MTRTQTWVHVDLNLDQVAMIIHTFLKKFEMRYQTLSMHTEKVCYDIMDEKNPGRCFSIEKYTLIIIASYDCLSNKELMKVLDNLQSNSFKTRGLK